MERLRQRGCKYYQKGKRSYSKEKTEGDGWQERERERRKGKGLITPVSVGGFY